MTAISYWPSSGAAVVAVTVPARQRINIGAGGTQSITRDQSVAGLSSVSLALYGPSGTLLASFTLDTMPGTWKRRDVGAAPYSVWTFAIPASVYAGAGGGAGIYTVTVVTGSGAEYQSPTVAFQWGGWVDTLMTNASTAATQATNAATAATTAASQATAAATAAGDAETAAVAAAADAELARKMMTNRVAPNDTTAPTGLVVYDDDGTTPLGTRTIANADGTAVSPAQILSLGPLV